MATKVEQAVEGAKELVVNDKLQNAVAAMVNKSIAAFEAGADFLSEQIPDILHQLLLWHAVYSGLLCVIGVLVLIAWIVADVKIGKWVWANIDKNGEESFVIGYLMLGSVPRILLALIVFNFINLTWLQIWIAPKVWLIEYAAKLVK